MDFYKKRVMISRQGKAISHLHPMYFAVPVKRPIPPEREKFEDLETMLSNLEKNPKAQEKLSESTPAKLSSSFKAISREKHEFTTRNRTESPKVGLYNPNWQVVRPTSAKIVKITKKKHKPRPKQIFTPLCITGEFCCSFPNRNPATEISDGVYIEKIKRTMSNLNTYLDKAEEKLSKKPDSEYLSNTAASFVDFTKQLNRKEIPPNEEKPTPKRFTFLTVKSTDCKKKSTRGFEFSKSTPRSELFYQKKISLAPYDWNEEKVMPKLSTCQLDMSKMLERQELVLEHMLGTPNPKDLATLDKAHLKQSNVRGSFNIPLMSTVTPRDDLMYRTTEAYCLNVPKTQSASSPPKFMGDVSVRAFKSTCTT